MQESKRQRGAVIVLDRDAVALIKRVRARRTYYLFPGGGTDSGESFEDAAVREAREELGLEVSLEQLLAIVHFRDSFQHYFRALVRGGEFGTGTGLELSSPECVEAGSYQPMWIRLGELKDIDVRPRCLIPLILDPPASLASPLEIVEEGR